jgi:adenylate cyclase, class 2
MRSTSKTGLRKSSRGAAQGANAKTANPKRANVETEIKLRLHDRPGLLRRLARLKAKLIRARVHEMNTLYDTAEGNLARHGQMLRIRVDRPARGSYMGVTARKMVPGKPEKSVWLTFKGPAKGARANNRGRYKVREEHEVPIFDDREMHRILEALGLRPWFRYEKFRSTFSLPRMKGLQVVIDETPIGLFLELEGEQAEIDRAAALLGFGPSDYISKSYGALFMERHGLSRPASHNEPVPSCGLPDMVFSTGTRKKSTHP